VRRRDLIALAGGAVAWRGIAGAQPFSHGRPVVAFVHAVIPPSEMAGENPVSALARAFVHGLRDLGWIEGQTVIIERRSAEGDPQRAASAVMAPLARCWPSKSLYLEERHPDSACAQTVLEIRLC
jgi:putative ABC transport system substrate-binding protein